MRVEAVLFDNDGTLVDTYDLIMESFAYATKEVLGRAVTEDEVMATGGRPLDDQMRAFARSEEQAAELSRVYRAYNHAIHDERIRLFDGVQDGLARLREAGVKMGVVTSKLRPLAWKGLQITGAAPFMGCCIGADDCPLHKPDPAPLLMAACELGVPANACAYLGDSSFDVQAANAAGFTSAAATWGMFPIEELAASSPDMMCDSFAEFVDRILAN